MQKKGVRPKCVLLPPLEDPEIAIKYLFLKSIQRMMGGGRGAVATPIISSRRKEIQNKR